MRQSPFVIPAETRLDAKTITASGTASDVVLSDDATLVKVQSVAGVTLVRLNATCVDSDGNWDVYIPDGGSVSFTVPEKIATTLSILGAGEVRVASYS